MKIFRIILNTLGVLLLCAMTVLVALLFINRINGKTTFIFGKTTVFIMTGSMEPEIEAESYILAEKITASDVTVGDVVVFVSDDPAIKGQLNTHRVIEIIDGGREFVTKGDNNAVPDKYTAKAENTVARYERVLPLMTAFMRFFLRPAGLLSVIIAVILIIGVLFVPDMKKYVRNHKASLEADKAALFEELKQKELEKLRAENPDAAELKKISEKNGK